MGRILVILLITAALITLTIGLARRSRPATPRTLGAQVRGDRVRFVFRPKQYQWTTYQGSGDSIPMRELRLRRVAVVGDFNDWNPRAWRLHEDEGKWVLSRSLRDLGSSEAFTFVVNDRFWVQSPPEAANRAPLDRGGVGLRVARRLDPR